MPGNHNRREPLNGRMGISKRYRYKTGEKCNFAPRCWVNPSWSCIKLVFALKFGVLSNQGKELPQRPAKHIFRPGLLLDTLSADGRIPGLTQSRSKVSFKCVTYPLHRGYQVRDQIIAPLELHSIPAQAFFILCRKVTNRL